MEPRRSGNHAGSVGILLATAWLVALTVVDILLPPTVVPDTLFAIAPLIACAVLSARATAGFAVAAVGPADRVVQVAHPGWAVAAVCFAAAGLDGLGAPLGLGVEPGRATEVEDLGPAAEDGGDDPGLAGQPAG